MEGVIIINPFEIIFFIIITIIFFFRIPFGIKILLSVIIGIICGMLGAFFDKGGDNDVDKTN